MRQRASSWFAIAIGALIVVLSVIFALTQAA